ncbi:MAG: PIN domain-containing protein, partial [Chthoniobacterales bacterium]
VEKSRGLDRGGSLEDFLRLFSIVDFGSDDARRYAEIRADLERKGTLIGPMDLLIAAHALRLGASLITRNAREFKRVKGLKVQAWK